MDLEEIIVNLRVLNKLDKHQKLITRGAYLNIESPSLIPESIRRWNRQENRFETIKKINAVVNAAISNVNTDKFDMKQYIIDAKVGIENLKDTYATCTQTCARLDLILDKINLLPVEVIH
jgi:hypothetical protein